MESAPEDTTNCVVHKIPFNTKRINPDNDSLRQGKYDHSQQNSGTAGHAGHESSQKPRKRRRKSTQGKPPVDLDSYPRHVFRGAEMLQQKFTSPDTLFFPSLPEVMKRDAKLRTIIGVPLEDLKTIAVRGKKMAWAKFPTEQDCMLALPRLKKAYPGLKVSIHRPRPETDQNSVSSRSNKQNAFQKRLVEIQKNGGVGNTLMFRNLPKEVGCDEVSRILRDAALSTEGQDQPLPLRIRTAISNKGPGRNFWVVYSNVHACQAAFVAIHLTPVSFRCGRKMKIHAFVHDDSTDADEKRRRQRATDLGGDGRDPSASAFESFAPSLTNVDHLENFLRQNRQRFVFMSPQEL